MLILLSPAKTLNFAPTRRRIAGTEPCLHAEAAELAAVAKRLSREEVAELMELSDRLADTAYGYLRDWCPGADAPGSKPAVLAFRGDVYQGLDADNLTPAQLQKAQRTVRILSGLYGVLRPLDRIQPYRLEMGRRLANPRGTDLYAWWGDRVTDALREDLAATPDRLIVNLASVEYAKVVRFNRLDARVVTPVFRDGPLGRERVVSFFAKRARGAMARSLLTTRSRGAAAVEGFAADGYRFRPELSTPDAPVFTRGRLA